MAKKIDRGTPHKPEPPKDVVRDQQLGGSSPYIYCYLEINGMGRCSKQCDNCKIYYRHLV